MAIQNRHELVFIYDTKMSNPNGDPKEEDELRMIGDKLYVTDTRLKRTIRDYWDTIGKDIFVKECTDEKGKVIDGMGRLAEKLSVDKKSLDKNPLTNEQLDKLKDFIDIRAFGSAIKVKMTGAVQFNFGKSMHDIEQVKVEGTSVFSSGDNKGQGTMTGMFITPYALISFHGIVNEQVANDKKDGNGNIINSGTGFTQQDLDSLKDGLWSGTKNLITRSKFEQTPRVLVDVKFKEGVNTHIGELDNYIKFEKNDNIIDEKAITDVSEGIVNFDDLVERLEKYADKIENVDIMIDERVNYKNLESGKVNLNTHNM